MTHECVPSDGPDPVDIFLGQRIRAIRKGLRLSQTDLGRRIGVSFQQVQKYESGANRLSVSMLFRVAQGLQTPLAGFFAGLPDPAESDSDLNSLDYVSDGLINHLGLMEAALRMPPQVRAKLVDLAAAIVAAPTLAEAQIVALAPSRLKTRV